MSTFESSIKLIPHRQETVYNNLSDLSRLERIKDRIPGDKAAGVTFQSDSIAIQAPMGGDIKLRIVDREPCKTIKFEAENSPVPFNFWIQLLPTGDEGCKMKLTIKADLNPLVKGMVAQPLKEALEKIADALAAVPYAEE